MGALTITPFTLALPIGGWFADEANLDMGNGFAWPNSSFLRKGLIAIILFLPCFIIRELGECRPLIDLRLFVYRNFTIGVICLLVGLSRFKDYPR
jgi:DHA2 family multidrug resistance protein